MIGANVTGTEFTSVGLTANNNYTYCVAAVDASGNESPKSNTVKVKTLPLDSQAVVFAAFSLPMAEFDLTPAVPVDLTAITSSAETTKWTWNATPFASALESLLEEEFWF